MTTNQIPDPESLKDIHELNPKALSDVLASALAEQVGGEFRVSLTKLEHTQPGSLNNKIILNFSIKDESSFYREQRNSDLIRRAYQASQDTQQEGNEEGND